MNTEEHKHVYKPRNKTVPIYGSVVYPSGQVEMSRQVGKDTLKQLKCECGHTITVDLERFEA